MQTKRQSLIETGCNTLVGFIGSWLITVVVLSYVDDKLIAATSTVVACTVWSLIRGYGIRRHFNRKNNNALL